MRALGFRNWNAWEATLVDERQVHRAQLKYPLVNDGRFDFIKPGEKGTPYAWDLSPLARTYERIHAVAAVEDACRTPSGMLEYEHSGESDIDWDSRTVVDDDTKRHLWASSEWDLYSEARVVLLPAGYVVDPFDDDSLPVREALVDACALASKALGSDDFEALQRKVGFALTRKEAEVLKARI